MKDASAPLLGSPIILSSSSPELVSRFSLPSRTSWAIIALKDHDASEPASIFYSSSSSNKLRSWLLSHRLPTSLELTQDTFQSVMNAPQAPLVVIAAVTNENKDKVKERFRDVGMKWRARTQGSGEFDGRDVVFTWMDSQRWGEWLKNMYGISKADAEDLEHVPVVIADHKVSDCLLFSMLLLKIVFRNWSITTPTTAAHESSSRHRIVSLLPSRTPLRINSTTSTQKPFSNDLLG